MQSFETVVNLGAEAKAELKWWMTELERWNGRPLALATPSLEIESDASMLGWGAASQGMTTGGL